MREDVLSLRAMGGDPVSEEYLKADLYHRAEALKDIPDAPLFFGRLDYAGQADPDADGDDGIAGHSFHIGRRHVHAPDGTPAVIDWRAPVSRPFYRASGADPMDLALRRRFGFSGGELTAYEDELFTPGRPGPPTAGVKPSRILLEEIERPRSGPMRDIVATIQPDQDDIVRADAAQTVCVQGAPGTGKTAVGLHRVAYLLYAHREQVRRRGVVMVGPNRAFLSYIRNVLPALGELDVTQTTVGELIARDGPRGPVAIRGTDSEAAAVVKGDARMAEVLARALWSSLRRPQAPLMLPRGSRRWRVPAYELAELAEELRVRGVRYGAARELLEHRIAHVILTQMEAAGEACDDRTHESVRRSRVVRSAVDAMWPKVDPVRLVFGLLSSAEALAAAAERGAHARRTGADRVVARPARPRLGALVAGRRRAHRRGARPDHADPQPGPRGGGRGAGPVADGVPRARPPLLHRFGHRPRRSRPGHHAVGGVLLGVAAVQPGQAGYGRAGALRGVPRAQADPRLRVCAAGRHRPGAAARLLAAGRSRVAGDRRGPGRLARPGPGDGLRPGLRPGPGRSP